MTGASLGGCPPWGPQGEGARGTPGQVKQSPVRRLSQRQRQSRSDRSWRGRRSAARHSAQSSASRAKAPAATVPQAGPRPEAPHVPTGSKTQAWTAEPGFLLGRRGLPACHTGARGCILRRPEAMSGHSGKGHVSPEKATNMPRAPRGWDHPEDNGSHAGRAPEATRAGRSGVPHVLTAAKPPSPRGPGPADAPQPRLPVRLRAARALPAPALGRRVGSSCRQGPCDSPWWP